MNEATRKIQRGYLTEFFLCPDVGPFVIVLGATNYKDHQSSYHVLQTASFLLKPKHLKAHTLTVQSNNLICNIHNIYIYNILYTDYMMLT